MGSRTNRAHDAKARAREARAVMLADRQAQDERIEDAVAAALLAIEDKAAALAEADQQERALAAALQRLGRERVGVGDIVTMTGLSSTRPTTDATTSSERRNRETWVRVAISCIPLTPSPRRRGWSRRSPSRRQRPA